MQDLKKITDNATNDKVTNNYDVVAILVWLKGLKQCSFSDIAKATELSDGYWKRVFTYKLTPSDIALEKISTYFGISVLALTKKESKELS